MPHSQDALWKYAYGSAQTALKRYGCDNLYLRRTIAADAATWSKVELARRASTVRHAKSYVAKVSARIAKKDFGKHLKRSSFEAALSCDPEIDDNPIGELEKVERDAMIAKAIPELDPDDQEILRRRFWNDESFEQIGKEIGKSPRTVKNRITGIKRQLRETLGDTFDTSD